MFRKEAELNQQSNQIPADLLNEIKRNANEEQQAPHVSKITKKIYTFDLYMYILNGKQNKLP